MNQDWQRRFAGVERLYGSRAARELAAARILVIGLGGVGSWALEALARTGVGALGIMDLDDVCSSNINRQLHALDSTVGLSKAAVLAARVADINPYCRLEQISDFLSEDNIASYVADYDLVIDAIDDAYVKAALIAHCKRRKISIVSTGAAGAKTDPGAISVLDLAKTYNDPLAAKVRHLLRSRYNFSRNPKRNFSVPCVFSSQQLVYVDASGAPSNCKSALPSQSGDCNQGFGAVSMVTASMGLRAAHIGIERLLRRRR